YSQQNLTTLLQKEVPFRFNDALAAQFQAYGHLGSVHQLFTSLTGNRVLAEFSWLLDWPKLDDARRRELYSKYACHELHFFLARKSPDFFKAVVLPHLASKRDKTFMDEYLLGMDLSRYLDPWHYENLNTLEKLLLAERIAADQPAARRRTEDWMNIQPVDRQRDLFLFETALRGRVLNGRGGPFQGRYGVVAAIKDSISENDMDGDGFVESGESGKTIGELELIKRQERTRVAMDAEAEGDLLFGRQDFAGALERYQNGLNVIPNTVSSGADRRRIISKFAKAAVIHARELGHRGEFLKAKSLLSTVLGEDLDPNYRDAQTLLKNLDDPERFNPAKVQSLAQTEEVKLHFQQALGFYDLGQFKEAEDEFNRILAIDSYNTAARRGLERTQRQVQNYIKSARDEQRLRSLKAIDGLWVDAVPGEKNLSLNAPAGGDDYQTNARMGVDWRHSVDKVETEGRATRLLGGVDYDAKDSEAASVTGAGPAAAKNLSGLGAGDGTRGFVSDRAFYKRQQQALGFEGGRLFRQMDKTKEWTEQNYYNLRITEQNAALVPLNRFWRDYAVRDVKKPFVSTNIADAAGTFTEMVLALAVLDLPFPAEAVPGKSETKDNVLTLTPAGGGVLFHQEVRPAEVDNAGAKLLVSQNFYREGDRYIEEGGEKLDKFVSAEFLVGVVYGCQVVVTNPSSTTQRLDALFQIPAGAVPVKATRRVQSLPVQIEPYRTQTLDFHFYFPEPGTFAHFPVHLSRNAKTAASASPFVFNVVAKPQKEDPASWEYVSQRGSSNEVLTFLANHNLYFLDLDRMLWRMKDADFFRRAIAHLKSRHVFHPVVWSYAVLHNATPYLTEYLMSTSLSALC
ncbi:MAG TPA: hypothetical protein VHM91_15480, partial [Verrucomicrobiales bacterium]|nr:hypothetical protein [Verrucomicrobiales bacterium]